MNKPTQILELEKEYNILLDQNITEHNHKVNSYGFDSEGNIIRLNLSGNKISDISSLKNLILLTNLNLSRNSLVDISDLWYLEKLEVLDLGYNQISDLSIFENLRLLKILNLNDNKISNIIPLQDLELITYLNLDSNQIIDISILEKLINLNYLSLNFNHVNNISFLENLKSLTELRLWRNQFSDISPLANLLSLTSLGLWKNGIKDISILKNLVSLEKLDIGNNKIIDISILADFKSLVDLDISYNEVPDYSILGSLKLLKLLNLRNCRISDITILDNLRNLTSLNLSENQISDFSVLQNLTSLTNLSLNHCKISDISILRNLELLIELNLNYNEISDISILKDLKHLIYLELKENQISDISILNKLLRLTTLYLDNNKIITINTLAHLEKLKKISLNNNEIENLREFDFLISKSLYIQASGNPCFKEYDINFEVNKNHYDLILNLLKKLNEDTNEYILPAKVLLLGNTGCGKSTILDYILQESRSKIFKRGLESTHIIQVETFPKKIRKNQIPDAVFYDFGGQDYYHGLYKAFLSNDSLNVLLWNPINDKNQIRKDRNQQFTRDYDRNYWLHQLKFQYNKNENLNEKSEPIILVQTHADDGVSNRDTYNGDSSKFNIINEFYLSFNSDAIKLNKTFDIGLRYFEETLNEQIKQKQIVKKEPIWYRDFLNFILRSTKRSHVLLSDLAKEYKRESDKDNYLLPEVLREIAQTGLILYYKDDTDLKDVVWLNPTGIIEDIHNRILSKDVIKVNKGIISQEVFDKIVKDEKIIKLLINQRVIFLDEYNNNYIIPGYLPLTEEEDKLYELLTFDFIEPSFILKFEYFIPFGLINQLICFYGKNKNKKHYWRDQLLFTKDHCKILIKLDFSNLEISVSIKSKEENKKLDKLQKEIFKDIIDIYWDKTYSKLKWIDIKEKINYSDIINLENHKYVNLENYKSVILENFKDGDLKFNKFYDKINIENLIETKWKSTIEDFRSPIISPEDLYISIDNKYFVNHKDLQNEDKTFNKIISFGLEVKKEKQNDKEVEIRRLNKNLFSEKATGLFRNFTDNKNAENMKRIFISYAKENKKQVNEFQKQIAPFKLTKEVETWHCSELELGEDWNSKIKSKFYEADIILYFVSTDFFSTPFILDEEVKRGIERDNDPTDDVVLIPIILEKIHWEDLLGKYSSNFKGKAINSYDISNNAWYEIIDDLKKHHFRKIDPNSTAGIIGQSKEKMKAQEDTIEGKS
jgi:internalin A